MGATETIPIRNTTGIEMPADCGRTTVAEKIRSDVKRRALDGHRSRMASLDDSTREGPKHV